MIRDEWTVLPLPPPSKEYRENYDSIFRKEGRPLHEQKVYAETAKWSESSLKILEEFHRLGITE